MKFIKIRTNKKIKFFSLYFFISACGPHQETISIPHERWDFINDPLQLSHEYERTLNVLPLAGQLKWAPWPDTYWPSYLGGIAWRWRTGEDGFSYMSPSRKQLKGMSMRERSLLSPAEKFDAFRGDYSYSMVAAERERTHPYASRWEGLCHGWAQASIQFQEPGSVLVRSVDGIDIPFGSSDIKGLLALLLGVYAKTEVRALGGRCNVELSSNPLAASSPECRDINAGAFHIVLANQLGRNQQSFILDIARGEEVWNHPIYSYQSKVLRYDPPSYGSHPHTKKEARIETSIAYTLEKIPSWDLIFPDSPSYLGKKIYEYRLELDEKNQIIGGEWLKDERPDFLWTQMPAPLTGSWEILKKIYEPSLNSRFTYGDPWL